MAWLGCELAVGAISWGRTYDRLADVPAREVGLVLGTSKFVAAGRLNLHYRRRIDAAVELFHAGKVRRLIVSGNGSESNYNEPRMMREDLIARGVPANRILSDDAGLRTFDSVVRAGDVFHVSRYTVISQRSHNERAIFIGQVRGQDVIGWNARAVDFQTDPRTALRERLARILAVLDVAVFNRSPRSPPGGNTLSSAARVR